MYIRFYRGQWYASNGRGNQAIIAGGSSASDPSDDRLKFDEQPLTGGVALVKQLKPTRYKQVRSLDDEHIDANARQMTGFIAQEVEEILPELVEELPDAHYLDNNEMIKGVNYNGLVAVSVQAIKELVAEVDALKARLAAAGIA